MGKVISVKGGEAGEGVKGGTLSKMMMLTRLRAATERPVLKEERLRLCSRERE